MSNHDDAKNRAETREKQSEERLDRALEQLRADGPSPAETDEALARVWARLEAAASAPAEGPCAELRAKLDELLAGSLSPARASLLEAHARECVPCRRLLKDSRSERTGHGRPAAAGAASRPAWPRWAAAAAVLITAVGLGALVADRLLPGAPGAAGPAVVAELRGSLFAPGDEAARELRAGDQVPAGRWLRTGKGSSAVLELADGSRVEMNERSQVLVRENQGSATLRLRRGDVIVEAARRKTRDLFVETEEMTVAVKGTIFTVEHGLKGSRVGVLEGSVLVESGRGASPLLEPGQQLASRSGLADRALREQVAWSRRYEQYRSLLDELEAVQSSLAERPFEHSLRHSTELLDAMPEGTVFYAALPNSSANLRRFVELVTERLDQSPELQRWWRAQSDQLAARGEPSFDEMLEALERLSDSLGEEVVVALVQSERGPTLPMLVSKLEDETELRAVVDAEIGERVRAHGGSFPGVGDRPALQAAAGERRFHVAAVDGLVLAGPSAPALLGVAERFGGAASGFAGSDFHRSLADEYRRGTETLIAFDLETLVEQGARPRIGGVAGPVLEAAGLTGLEHFILRSDEDDLGTAVLSFSEDRRGLASWIAEPGPMGSLEFVSARATIALSAVLKDPEAMLRDLRDVGGLEDFAAKMEAFRAETGVDLFSDVAAPLGGEITVALDGPLFPTPAWKVVLETYDPVRLQQTIERLVGRFNEWSAEQAAGSSVHFAPLELVTTEGASGPRHALRMEGLPTEVHYAFEDGYLVATGAAHRLESALSDRELGTTILSAESFTGTLPKDGRQHFSLVAWQNLGPALGLVLQGLGQAALPPGQSLPAGGLDTACMIHGRASDRQVAFSISSAGAGPGAQIAALLRHALVSGLQQAAEQGLLDVLRTQPGYDAPSAPQEPDDAVRPY